MMIFDMYIVPCLVLSYLQVTCFVQPPVPGEAAVDAAAASAIAVYVEELQRDVPDSSAPTRPLSHKYDSSRRLPNPQSQLRTVP
ncbi:hypothetical protein PBY51_008799 [Eleginops maclovinus]|uniref:Secreted protein n=1 Tax=Eleginops maclovinus TaxID=56733 RepID=A0AAN7WV30_ELEMC|nr:hypothetical protein PBY51_008799 [Eleginops maclovinus]